MLRIFILCFSLCFLSFSLINAQDSMNELPVKLYSDNEDGFVVIAHRGASAYHPENTMAAFRAAVEMQAEMIELDITLSKDGILVAIHDETLDRTTNGSGYVSDFTVEELKALDAGSWFDEDHRGEPIPTLEEVLQFAQDKIALNIEIKTESVTDELADGIEEKAWELVKKYGMEDYVLFSSFDYRAIRHLKEINVDISAALLYEKKQSEGRTPSQLMVDYNADAFNCSYRQYSKKWAGEAKNKGFPVFVYTVNSERRIKKMVERGAAGIFSDKPDLLKQIVDKLWKSKR